MADRPLTPLIGSFDTDEIVTWPGKTVLGLGVPIFRMFIHIAVGLRLDLLGAVAEIPGFVPECCSEASYFEGHRLFRVDARCGSKGRVNRGRKLIRGVLVDDKHNREIVIHLAAR